MAVIVGLERLSDEKDLQNHLKGQVGLLCHSASLDRYFNEAPLLLHAILGERLKKIFGPQHGFVTDVQDNMIETNHGIHPMLGIPIYSLYSETRIPTDEMLAGLDTLVIDLQDVGTRIYTYISTLTYLLRKISGESLRIVILDRPNPAGGTLVEGTVLDPAYESFVGVTKIPVRHGLTIGEFANFVCDLEGLNVDLHVITMQGWHRSMTWTETERTWINPSPNLSTPESTLTFTGTVLYEGTNLSEGRGTTRALEQIGFPGLNPYEFIATLKKDPEFEHFFGMELRPVNFYPMFQKHKEKSCGGVFIHPTNPINFHGWRLGQWLLKHFKNELSDKFAWNDQPYEYETEHLAIDYINGGNWEREWVERSGSLEELVIREKQSLKAFLDRRANHLLY